MKDYEINDETLAIIPDDIWNSIVVEDNCDYEVSRKPIDIVDYSCNISNNYIHYNDDS